jgi:hypothetical protein
MTRNKEISTPAKYEPTDECRAFATGFKNIIGTKRVIETGECRLVILKSDVPEKTGNIDCVIISEISKNRNITTCMPKKFEFPAYTIHVEKNSPKESATTREKLADYIVCSDNNIYCLSTNYLINEKGQAVKWLNISRSNQKFSKKQEKMIDKYEFTPTKMLSDCNKLNSKDYKVIDKLLADIKKGKFKEV